MTRDEMFAAICEAEYGDWIQVEEAGVYTLAANLNIRVERDEDAETLPLREEWVKQFPRSDATLSGYKLYYGCSLVKRFSLVYVDGRAYVPLPEQGALTASRLDLGLARAVDLIDQVGEYIERCGITII